MDVAQDRKIVVRCPVCGWCSEPAPSSGGWERDRAGQQWRNHWHEVHTPYPVIAYVDTIEQTCR